MPISEVIKQLGTDIKTGAAKTVETGLQVGANLIQPEVIGPAAAALAAGMVGGPAASIPAAGAVRGLVEAQRLAEEKGISDSLKSRIIQAAAPGPLALAEQTSKGVETGKDVKQVAGAAIGEAAIQATGEGILKAVSRFRKTPLFVTKPRAIPVAQEANAVLKQYGGPGLSLAQLTENRSIDFADRVARGGLIKSNILPNLDAANEQALLNFKKELSEQFYTKHGRELSRQELATLIREEGIDIGRSAQRAIERNLYDRVDDLAGGVVEQVHEIPRPGLKGIVTGSDIGDVAPVLVERRVGGVQVPIKRLKEYVETLRPTAKSDKVTRLITGIKSEADQISFLDAHQIRSDLLDLSRDLTDPGLVREAKTLSRQLDQQMGNAAANHSRDLYKAWRGANRFFRKGQEVFNNTDYMAKLFVDKAGFADDVGKAIYANGERVEPIQQVLKAAQRSEDMYKLALKKGIKPSRRVNASQIKQGIKSGWYEELFNKNWTPDKTLPSGGKINFQGILSDLEDRNVKEQIKVLFSPDEIGKLKEWAKTGQVVQARSPGTSGALTLVQTAALSAATVQQAYSQSKDPSLTKFAGAAATAALVLSTPHMLSKILANPKSIRLLMQGTKELSKGGKQAVSNGVATAIRLGKSLTDEQTQSDIKSFLFAQPYRRNKNENQ